MSTLELKELLIEKINATEDEELLQEFALFFDVEPQSVDDYEISAEEIAAIEDGRKQIKNGQFVTNEESNKRVDEWVKAHAGR